MMLIGVAVGMHGYDGPGAMAITIAVPVLLVLILVGVYGRKKRLSAGMLTMTRSITWSARDASNAALSRRQ
jgi:hypothetical protein